MEQKKETIANGMEVSLRLLVMEDLDKLMSFYTALPFEDRQYLKVDVTNRGIVEKRLKRILENRAARVIAVHDDNIIAEGELFIADDDWHRDEGEIRVIVSRDFQRKGIGTVIMKELYNLALENKIERVIAKMMKPQTGFQFILKKFGFQEQNVLTSYATDQAKKRQDMLIMTCEMRDFWSELKETLKDGTKVKLRLLSVNEKDIEKLMNFYKALPYEDRKYLKVDVTDEAIVRKRLKSIQEKKAVRVIALYDEYIIAEGELFLKDDDWYRDQGEIRVIVSRDFQRRGLGMIMMRELYYQALKHKVEHVVSKMMTPQTSFKHILEKFGFQELQVLNDYAIDRDHHKQDMLIMTCDMKRFWRELDTVYRHSDWQRCR